MEVHHINDKRFNTALELLMEGVSDLIINGVSFALNEDTKCLVDMTSPAHGFDKEYKIPTMTVLVPIPGTAAMVPVTVTDVKKWKQELDEHGAQESGSPTDAQRAQTAMYSRAFFLIAFGEKEFKRLEMTDEERKAARDLAAQYRRSQ